MDQPDPDWGCSFYVLLLAIGMMAAVAIWAHLGNG
jgi:hypothetical protein